MRILPSGTTAILVELADLEEVLGLYAALAEDVPTGVVDIVPAARTLLLVTDPAVTSLSSVEDAGTDDGAARRTSGGWGELVEIPVTYDGEDLAEAARLLGCAVAELVRRHTAPSGPWRSAASSPGSAT